MKIAIINGPNLNLTGTREPELYGKKNFSEFMQGLTAKYREHEITYFQSNVEGELINHLHDTGFSCDGIILNAGAYSHTSLALADAIRAISTPVVEVHLSNIFARENHRHVSYTGAHSSGCISGFGLSGYELALLSFLEKSKQIRQV